MSLGLNITELEAVAPRTPLQFEVVRELTEADINLIQTVPAGEKPPEIKRISDRHHMLARLLAAGVTEEEASLQTGYTLSRISILKQSRIFQDLMAFYREKMDAKFDTVIEHMAGLSKDSLLELRDRLEESADRFTNSELLKIFTEIKDRTDNGGMDEKDLPTVIELVAPEQTSSSLSVADGRQEGEEAD